MKTVWKVFDSISSQKAKNQKLFSTTVYDQLREIEFIMTVAIILVIRPLAVHDRIIAEKKLVATVKG